MATDYKPYDVELLPTTLSTNGTYTLNDDVTKYSKLQVLFGTKQESGSTSHAIDLSGMSLIPILTSNSDQGYVCTASSVLGANFLAYNSFNGSTIGSWVSAKGSVNNQWLSIQKTDGTIRANMFSIYHGGSPTYNYTYKHLKIQGSNDGENWDTLVEDNPGRGLNYYGETYILDDYVEYSHYRIIGNAVSTYTLCREFLIQDSALHLYSGDDYEASKTAEGFSYTGDQGTVTITGNQLVLSDLTTPVASISGLSTPIVPHYYKLYRKGTDGTPTLFMPEQTTIGSSLGNSDLSGDLASLASKKYVTDTIDSLSRSSLAGKVDTVDLLPNDDVRIGTMYLVGTEGNLEEYIYCESQEMIYDLSADHASASSYRRSPNSYPPSNLVNGDFTNTSSRWMALPEGTASVGEWCQITIPSEVIGTNNSIYVTTMGPQGTTSHMGASDYINYDVVGVKTDGTLSDTITSITIRRYTQEKINISGIVNDGYTGIRFICTNIVGPYLIMDEIILTYTAAAWERIGEIRQSDVDLSGYTNTEGMTSMLDELASDISTNIQLMDTEIEATITNLDLEIGGAIQDLPLDTQFLEAAVPTTWPSHLEDNGMMFIIEPDIIPYTAPELRTDNGTPFVDEYAVSASSVWSGTEVNRATYDDTNSDGVWHSAGEGMPQYLYMTFKTPLQATSIYIRNRNIASNNVYAVRDFVIEGKDGDEWTEVYRGTNTSSGVYGEYEVTFENDAFYNEYRLAVLSSHGGAEGNNYVAINVARLSGTIKN